MARHPDAVCDDDLIRAARAGDDSAFAALYQRHRTHVERVCRRWLRDSSAIDDCVNETFLRAYTALPSFRTEGRVAQWLGRIARNVAVDELRKAQRRREEAAHPVPELSPPHHRDEVPNDSSAFVEALRRLKPRDAEMLVSHHVDYVSLRELAQRHGLTEGTVAVALNRARHRLRAELARVPNGAGLLTPVGLWARVARWLRRSAVVDSTWWPAAASVVGSVATLAAGLVLVFNHNPMTLDAEPPSPGMTTLVSVDTSSFDEPESPRATDAGRELIATDAALHESPQGGSDRAARPDGLLTQGRTHGFDVPVTGDRVGNERPPEEPDYAYGFRVYVEGHPVGFVVESWDEPDQRPVDEAACSVAEQGDPLTHCSRRPVEER